MLEDEGAVYRNIILKEMTSVETTLLYLSLSHLQKSELWKAHWSKTKPVYAEVWRNKPPLACRKLFSYVTYECIKYITTGEKVNIETFVKSHNLVGQRQLSEMYMKMFSLSFDCLTPVNPTPCSICISTDHTLWSIPRCTGKRTY
jgi:hypothetical protein